MSSRRLDCHDCWSRSTMVPGGAALRVSMVDSSSGPSRPLTSGSRAWIASIAGLGAVSSSVSRRRFATSSARLTISGTGIALGAWGAWAACSGPDTGAIFFCSAGGAGAAADGAAAAAKPHASGAAITRSAATGSAIARSQGCHEWASTLATKERSDGQTQTGLKSVLTFGTWAWSQWLRSRASAHLERELSSALRLEYPTRGTCTIGRWSYTCGIADAPRSIRPKSDARRSDCRTTTCLAEWPAQEGDHGRIGQGGDAGQGNVSITLDLAPGLPLVSGDRVQLQQVPLNLVVNAFDAPADVADRPRKVILRTRTLGGRFVQLDVADTGPGIAPAKLESIFQPFVTTKPSGMGMGLSVSHSIVGAHEGRLWAENDPEGGTFHIVLPALPDEAGFP